MLTAIPSPSSLPVHSGEVNWVKMHGLPPGAHLWLQTSSETVSPFAGREDKDDIRSPFISPKTQPEDEWVPVEFEFTVAPEEAGQLFRPHFILKGNPSGTENDFPPEARVLIDDLVINRKQPVNCRDPSQKYSSLRGPSAVFRERRVSPLPNCLPPRPCPLPVAPDRWCCFR